MGLGGLGSRLHACECGWLFQGLFVRVRRGLRGGGLRPGGRWGRRRCSIGSSRVCRRGGGRRGGTRRLRRCLRFVRGSSRIRTDSFYSAWLMCATVGSNRWIMMSNARFDALRPKICFGLQLLLRSLHLLSAQKGTNETDKASSYSDLPLRGFSTLL